MSKVSIVYWSGTGNTEAMANMIAEGVKEAGKEADVLPVSIASVADLQAASAFALGCPSMGVEQLEEAEMEPFMCELESGISGKQVGLFGSYGWGNEEWMRDWEERIGMAGASVVNGEGIAVNGAPGADAEGTLKDLGRTLAGLVD